jgi:hypothetical protein
MTLSFCTRQEESAILITEPLMKHYSYILLLVIMLPFYAAASETEFTGFLAIEQRQFFEPAKHAGQERGEKPSFIVEPEVYHISDDGNHVFTFKPFYRYDQIDDERTHGDIRQLDWVYANDGIELRAGFSKVFWGVAEHNHLVDIINQTDAVEGADGEDKLGQPMFKLGVEKDWGNLQFFYLPYFRERTFIGERGRNRPGSIVDGDQATYESGAKEWQPSFALRYSHYFGSWDVGLSHFYGTSREPRFVSSTNGNGDAVFAPFYDVINQTGMDIQYTKNGWLWKFEAISRESRQERFFAGAGGLEYTFYSALDSDKDLGVLLEYSRDDRGGLSDSPFTQLDDDIFIGTRLMWNNVQDTQMLAGIVVDRNDHARFVSFEASHRLNENLFMELEMRANYHLGENSLLSDQSRDDYAQLQLSYYF